MFPKNRLKNKIYNTFPCHYHGNGGMNIKVKYNNYCNYLLKQWNPTYQCCLEKKDFNDKSIYIFIYNDKKINEDLFFSKLDSINYPKNKIVLHISSKKTDYRLLGYDKVIFSDSTYKSEGIIRENSMKECIVFNCDYYLNIDPNVIIENNNIIYELLSYNKNIVSPLFNIKNANWSNFWGDITNDGWYNLSFNYFDILNREQRGCWNVPYINHMYLIKKDILNKINNFYQLNYDKNKGYDMSFCENLRKNNYFMNILNVKNNGHLIEKEKEITIFDYNENTDEYINKYFTNDFIKSYKNYKDLNIKEPIQDVIQFSLVNDTFCNELIEVCEKYGKWSGAKNNDSRIGYENIPSNDIHFTELDIHEMWENIIIKYISPIVSYHWGTFKTTSLNIGFVVKYEKDKFYRLEPHHDSSSYTVNISLNDDYEGGEINFIKKGKIKNKKGHALIHPGRITHYHEGLPVTEGVKYICVSFVY